MCVYACMYVCNNKINNKMIWQNDGRCSGPLLVGEQWGKNRESKNKRGVWCGKTREQLFNPRTKLPSLFHSPFLVLHPN